MITSDSLKEIKSLVQDFKPQIGFFERNILVPGMYDRLNYVLSIFQEFYELTKDSATAISIDAAVKKVLDHPNSKVRSGPKDAGAQYLSQVGYMLKTSYIDHINGLKNRYQLDVLKNSDIETIVKFLTDAKYVFDGIVGVKEKSFLFSMKTIVSIKDNASGEVVLGPPQELNMILFPFETRMSELVNVAKTSSESIDLWSKQIKEQQNKHIELIAYATQVEVSKEQANSTRMNIWFQISVTAFAIILVILSQPINTYIQQKIVENALERKSSEMDELNKKLNLKLELLERELTEAKNKLLAVSSAESGSQSKVKTK